MSVQIAGPYASRFLPILSIGSKQSIHSAVTLKLGSFRCHHIPELLANEKRVFNNFRKRQLTQLTPPAMVVTIQFLRSIC